MTPGTTNPLPHPRQAEKCLPFTVQAAIPLSNLFLRGTKPECPIKLVDCKFDVRQKPECY